MQRTNQGGSVISFVVIGVVLILMLIGTVYLMNQRSQQVRNDQAIATKNKQQTEKESTNSDKNDKSTTAQANENKDTSSTVNSAGTDLSQNIPASGSDLSVSELFGVYILAMMTTAYLISVCKIYNF